MILPHLVTPSSVAQQPKYHFNHHSGPVLCLQRSPFFKDIVLSVGGWSFAVWREGCEVSMLPRYSCVLTHAHYLLTYVLHVHPCTYIHTYVRICMICVGCRTYLVSLLVLVIPLPHNVVQGRGLRSHLLTNSSVRFQPG